MKYGVDQCIGDTIGPGGLFKACRHDARLDRDPPRRRTVQWPGAVVLNYTNPMSMTVLTGSRQLDPRTGCATRYHYTVEQLAEYLDVGPMAQLRTRAGSTLALDHRADPRWRGSLSDVAHAAASGGSCRILHEQMYHLARFVTESSGTRASTCRRRRVRRH